MEELAPATVGVATSDRATSRLRNAARRWNELDWILTAVLPFRPLAIL